MTTKTFRDPWLVQRLERPFTSDNLFGGKDNPFAFGGGFRNGGLSDEAMDLLRPLFRFAYMGSAEFEFGAVPKALNFLAQSAQENALIAFEMDIPLSEVKPHWNRKKEKAPEGSASVWVLCRGNEFVDIEASIRRMALDKTETKEHVGLSSALRPDNEWDTETIAWLAVDFAFMFFVDRDVWVKTCALFGVDVES